VLVALKALSNVADGDIAAADAADSKVNFLWFRWTDPDRTDPIEVVENQLLPLTQANQSGSATPFGFTQLVKLSQFPLAMTSNFERPSSPAVTVIETRAGASGVNAEQTIIVPSGATGSVAFVWSGAQTKSMAVQTMTASSIAAALNAIVAGGDTNPSYSVEDRPAREGKRFAVQMIGPLAGAAQDLLGRVMIDQESLPYASGTLDLADFKLGIEQALNGEPFVDLPFELAIDADGEETILHTLRILNDMTSSGTEEDAAAAGAVTVREIEVVVDNSTTEAFATVAPGATFSPPAAVSADAAQSVNHALGTRNPRVWGEYQSSLDPEEWRELQYGEFSWTSTDANHVRLNVVYAISDDPDDEFYRERFRFYIASPDAVLEIFGALKFLWSQCLESLPDGQTLTAKLAAIDTALGVIGGTLRMPASSVDGQLQPAQIDIEALAKALKTSQAFLDTLRALITDSTLIDKIAEALRTSTSFLTTLKALIVDTGLLAVLGPALLADPVFTQGLRVLIVAIIQGTAGALTDSLLMVLPTIDEYFPSPTVGTFLALPKAVFAPTSDGAVTGYVPRASASNAGHKLTVGSGGAILAPNRRKTFVSGDVIFSTGEDWFLAEILSTAHYAKEFSRELFTLQVNDQMLSVGTRFAVVFNFSLQLLGNCEGYFRFTLERGTANAAVTAGTNVSTITVDETVIDVPIIVTDVATTHLFGYAVTRGEDVEGEPVLSATKQIYTKTGIAATAPGAPKFVLRARLSRFDVEDVDRPRGQLRLTTPASQVASIVRLT
jgi:hypothetical protein